MAIVAGDYKKFFSTNQTAVAAPSAYSATKPSNLIVEDGSPSAMAFVFFGTNAADETFTFRLWGVSKVTDDGWYLAEPLFSAVTVTLGAATGAAGGTVVAADYWADTVSAPTDTGSRRGFWSWGMRDSDSTTETQKTGADEISGLICLTAGYWGIVPSLALGTATNGNFLWTPLSETPVGA